MLAAKCAEEEEKEELRRQIYLWIKLADVITLFTEVEELEEGERQKRRYYNIFHCLITKYLYIFKYF